MVGLGGKRAALLYIAQIGQIVAVGADEVHGEGPDPVHKLLFSLRSRSKNPSFRAGARGPFKCDSPEKASDDLLRINDVGRMSCPIERWEIR